MAVMPAPLTRAGSFESVNTLSHTAVLIPNAFGEIVASEEPAFTATVAVVCARAVGTPRAATPAASNRAGAYSAPAQADRSR